ncbi:MAG: KAP family NTPase [Rhodospirillaceae bacterium]
MSSTAESQPLSGDHPITSLEQDRLGYAPFARAIAKAIAFGKSGEGLVLALHGPWGSGKTSAVNLIEQALPEHQKGVPVDSRIIVVRFNPWWFSERQDLARTFFMELSASLGGDVPDKIRNGLKAVARHVSGATDLVGGLLSLLPAGELANTVLGEVVALAGKGLDENRSLDDDRNDLCKALKEQGRRILVLIDDIDRLPADEARQIFRLVKSVADLPNVTYLLIFDRAVAARAFQSEQTAEGPEWLEKIVQASFDLPPVNRLALREMLFAALTGALGQVDIPDQGRWSRLFLNIIDPCLRTPRDVVRLVNVLSVSYPAVADEVDFADFLALETLRIFEPALYAVIRDSATEITGLQSDRRDRQDTSIGDRLLGAMQESRRSTLKSGLEVLFPRLEGVWGNRSYSGDFMRGWDQQRRCCVPRRFPAYFTFSIGEEVIPRGDLQQVLAALNDSGRAEAIIMEYASCPLRAGGTRASLLLEELRTAAAGMAASQAQGIVRSVLHAGDGFLTPEDESKGMLPVPQVWFVGFLIQELLERVEPEHRYSLLAEAVQGSPSLRSMAWVVMALSRQYGRHTEEPERNRPPTLSEDEVIALEAVLVERLSSEAREGRLLELPTPISHMVTWSDLAGTDVVREWLNSHLETDHDVVRVARALTSTDLHKAGDDPTWHENPRVNRKNLEPLVDFDRLLARLDAVEPTADADGKAIIDRFRRGLASRDFPG